YATPAAGSISFYTTDGDVRRYRGGDPVPAAVLRRRLTVGRLSLGRAIRAAPDGYLRLLGSAQIVRDGFAPSPEMVERRTTAAVGLAAELSRARFVELTHFRSLGRPEDVDLSPTLRLGLQAAPAFL